MSGDFPRKKRSCTRTWRRNRTSWPPICARTRQQAHGCRPGRLLDRSPTLKGQTEPNSQFFFRRFLQTFAFFFSWELQHFGGADFRRKPQIFAENLRKPQIFRRNRFVPFSLSLVIPSYGPRETSTFGECQGGMQNKSKCNKNCVLHVVEFAVLLPRRVLKLPSNYPLFESIAHVFLCSANDFSVFVGNLLGGDSNYPVWDCYLRHPLSEPEIITDPEIRFFGFFCRNHFQKG